MRQYELSDTTQRPLSLYGHSTHARPVAFLIESVCLSLAKYKLHYESKTQLVHFRNSVDAFSIDVGRVESFFAVSESTRLSMWRIIYRIH